ncbi:glycoside hydrolase family 13 protein [Vallitalea okinawensis]|uniref:glycoside hydrolase family 13 protein n=1 Tax=Vallitalea okinawensis TaxID=2078660 RepID=UPI000CFC6961|nr:glycoside hydrolase family 13 protein [Vallitalea okinawensis]
MHEIQVIHNSHNKHYRNPFGAVICGTTVDLTIDVIVDMDQIYVTLELFEAHQHRQVAMELSALEGNRKTFTVQYNTTNDPGLVWYYFSIHTPDSRYYYSNNNESLGGIGKLTHEHPKGYQLTVHHPFTIPEWYKESIIYQIFPDRFFNGDKEINFDNYKKNSLIHANWDDKPYYIKDEKGHVKRWDFFGGNLLGIIKKIKHLKKLGVSTIYLNPIFESVSNHKYDTGNYKRIDPAFGDEENFNSLIEETQNNKMAIILDGVFSHTGSDSIYFNRESNYPEVGAYQSQDSPYYNWFRFQDYPDQYECWWGVDTLPNVNEMEPTYIDYMVTGEDSVVRRWIQKGAKGWRLDVADELPDEFIKEIKRVMKETNQDSVLIGEVWEDASRKESYGKLREYFWGKELDGVMNYPFRELFINFVRGVWDAEYVHKRLMSLYENYPKECFFGSMNLIGSHDRTRIMTLLGEAPEEHHLTDEERENYRLSESQRSLAIKRLKLLSLIQYTFPGIPHIYYGDEVGMEGYSDPYNRGTFPWGRENQELINWYMKLGDLRNNNQVLRKGEWRPFVEMDDVYGYYRVLEKTKVLCLFNRHVNRKKSIMIPDIPDYMTPIELMENKRLIKAEELILEPLQGKVILIEAQN